MSAQPLQMPSKLPRAAGFRLLLKMHKSQEKVGLLYKPEDVRALEDAANIVAQVVDVGPQAYKDETRFPYGPWCKTGDWVLFRQYDGTRMKVGDQEYRLIADDRIEAVVEDPAIVGCV